MIRKKIPSKYILQKLADLEAEYAPLDKPFIAFIEKLSNGTYKVVEHIGVGRMNGNKKFKSVKYEITIYDTEAEYFATNPDWLVIYGEENL